MTKFVNPPKDENLTSWEEKEINKIKAWERIYREPQNFEHIELTCMGNDWDYKVFRYYTYGWEEIKIKIKHSDYVEAREDDCWHVKSSSEILPYEKENWDKRSNY